MVHFTVEVFLEILKLTRQRSVHRYIRILLYRCCLSSRGTIALRAESSIMGTMVRTSALAVYALYEGFFRRFGSGGGALQYDVIRVTPLSPP